MGSLYTSDMYWRFFIFFVLMLFYYPDAGAAVGSLGATSKQTVRKRQMNVQARQYLTDAGKMSRAASSRYYATAEIALPASVAPTATLITCTYGQFLPANSTSCTSCKSGYECPGGKFYKANYDQGLEQKGTKDNGQKQGQQFADVSITCAAGKYLPANATSCSSCKDRYYCPGGTFVVASYDQGIVLRDTAKTEIPVKSITCSSGAYLPANATSCSSCKDRYYCPGGTFIVANYDQGMTQRTITCSSGKYLPANMNSCSPCKDRYYCPGGTFAIASYDQGITMYSQEIGIGVTQAPVTCPAAQYLPAKANSCSPCQDKYYCPGGTYAFSLFDQGMQSFKVTCNPGYYLPAQSTTCSPCANSSSCPGGTFSYDNNPQGILDENSVYCETGQYLPRNTKSCKKCETNSACPGGIYEFNSDADQGITLCPKNSAVSENKASCAFSRDALLYGTTGYTNTLSAQCWTKSAILEYKDCLLNK